MFVGLELVKMLPRACSGKIMRRVLKRVWTSEALGHLHYRGRGVDRGGEGGRVVMKILWG